MTDGKKCGLPEYFQPYYKRASGLDKLTLRVNTVDYTANLC